MATMQKLMTTMFVIMFTGGCAASSPLSVNHNSTKLIANFVQSLPVLDGSDHDEVWKQAGSLQLNANGVWGPSIGKVEKVSIKALYTDSYIAFLVSWADVTRDDKHHKPWVWNADKKEYERGTLQEDAMALAFELNGPFTGDMLSAVDAIWDLWTWKATRSDPVDHALDKTHRFSTTQPAGKAREYKSRAGTTVWIQRPDDAGSSTQSSLPAPTEYRGDVMPAYLIKPPSGSASDVRAKGAWKNGRWTVELLRKLDTGNPDDTKFSPEKYYAMAIALQDQTGDMDKATPVFRLGFKPK